MSKCCVGNGGQWGWCVNLQYTVPTVVAGTRVLRAPTPPVPSSDGEESRSLLDQVTVKAVNTHVTCVSDYGLDYRVHPIYPLQVRAPSDYSEELFSHPYPDTPRDTSPTLTTLTVSDPMGDVEVL